MGRLPLLMAWMMLAACGGDRHEVEAEFDPERSVLTADEVLTRASLDLRGRLPSQEELQRLQSSPEQLYVLIDGFLEDPSFGLRVRDLFAGAYRTRSATYFITDEEDAEDPEYQRAAGEEILKIIEHIAVEDRPFTEVVTGDYTFANEAIVEHWPIEGYDEDEGGWQKVEYSDGRPMAGVLSTNGFHMRYLSDDQNYNRARANALSRILLCDNYLKRPIDFPRNIDLTDEDAIGNAIRNNAACVSCHATLDPMASFLFGFPSEVEGGIFDEDVVDEWAETTGQAPSFYGVEGEDVSDLGAAIAEDARFARCATRRVFEGMVGRRATPEDAEALDGHREAFLASGMRLKVLLRSVLRDPVYQGGGEGVRPAAGAKIMSPEVLEQSILALTGYQLLRDDVSLLRSDEDLHVLAGGLSHESGDHAPRTSNVTRVLVQSQLAEGAALYLVEEEAGAYDEIFDGVDMEAYEPDPRVLAQVYRWVLGVDVDRDDPEVEALAELWEELVDADLDPPQAWAGVLSVMLRDPRFIHY